MALLFVLLSFFNTAEARDYGDYHNDHDNDSSSSRTADHWGYLLMPSFTYIDVDEDNEVPGGATAANDYRRGVTLFDAKLGHTFRGGFYVGVMYANELHGISDIDLANTRESFGVSAGFLKGGWSVIATYFFHSRQLIEPDTEPYVEYDDGQGFQIELGYHFQVNSFLHIGPTIAYKNFTYAEAEDATGVDADADSNHTMLTPMLSMIFVLHK